MLNNLKTDLTGNELLLADFPEVIYPIHRLENQTRRCVGQIHHGQSTYIGWVADEIILPAIPGSRAARVFQLRSAGCSGPPRKRSRCPRRTRRAVRFLCSDCKR